MAFGGRPGPVRLSSMLTFAAIAAFVGCGVARGDAEEASGWDTDHDVVVRLGNYAPVKAGLLADAARVAQSVLAAAGVRTQWRDCTAVGGDRPCANEGASRAVLAIELFGRGQARALARSPSALGLAFLPKREGERLVAIVFVEEAKAQAHRAGVPLHVVLGHTMAHEAGHLLLGASDHAVAGLMQARWSSRDLAHAAQGQLRFSEEESARLRAGVLKLAHPLAAEDGSSPPQAAR